MDNSQEQNTDSQLDPYLKSPEVFHLEMPLYYSKLDLSNDVIQNKIYELLFCSDTIFSYCIWCKRESVFKKFIKNKNIVVSSRLSEAVILDGLISDGLIALEYRCAGNESHSYHFCYFKDGNFFTKVGQYPSVADFQIPQVEKYRKILGDEKYKEFTRGIGLAAHCVGIGSFVYLRRVFEYIIEEAHKEAKKENKDFPNDEYFKARMDEKIKMVKDYLPEILVQNRKLYAILSKGIHDLTEDECKEYFKTVKNGIELILDEKIAQKEEAEKEAKLSKAIQKIRGEITNPK
ncbi:hypothetical protein EM20IM_06215 [Candidatus Methylacidiphilum infernorum]|uniref:Uncharacterized protein n=1 Tax=Candidatus Methylacidiphilum infernorum TaxID=511746 RepID=A0ABX7PT05_9BACT|nr:hypothetical protein [Candidatus Methylacidiphilum infernorum]QSR86105.1 hypothetical protein EM20IM_06215 [Candidatus Methylacidiphilum infernorum]